MRIIPSFTIRRSATAAGARRLSGAAFFGLWGIMAVSSMAVSSPAAAQGFGETDLLKSTLSVLGLVEDEEKPEIEYRERAPLVVPPTIPQAPEALPAPQQSAAAGNPNWPKDHDAQRRKQAAADARKPIVRDDPGRPLMPSELNKGKRKTQGAYADGTQPADPNGKRDVLSPSELGFTGWLGSVTGTEKPLSFNGEPERESLVQPPPGYQTPAPNAPYGVVEAKKEPFKFPTLFDAK